MELLISNAGDTRNATRLRAMIELLYASGLRVSELCELPMTGILGEKLLIHGKGAKERMVPMHAGAQEALAKWLEIRGEANSKYVFPSTSKTGHITRDGFFQDYKKMRGFIWNFARTGQPSCSAAFVCFTPVGRRCKLARNTNDAGT